MTTFFAMGASDLGPWEPMTVDDAVDLFGPATFRWWLSGGHALEAHVGCRWRGHDDTDIGLTRSDAPRLLEVLDGWDLHVGAAGVLTPWTGEPLDPTRHQHNLWGRPTPDSPWMLDVTIGEGSAKEWIYRRDRRIRRPWTEAVLTTADGLPYLAPELQLLYKSNDVRPKDDADAAIVIGLLDPERRGWLAAHLPAGHPWARLAID